jgi:hypothetical protein
MKPCASTLVCSPQKCRLPTRAISSPLNAVYWPTRYDE